MKSQFSQDNELIHMHMFQQDFVYILELTYNSKVDIY